MAYMKAIYKPKCQRCEAPATDELFSHRNEALAYYCKRCGKAALASLKRDEGQS